MSNAAWPDTIFEQLLAHHVQQVAYVPDAGHSQLIERCRAHADMITVPLTTEEEGVALLGGAWLGGQRGVARYRAGQRRSRTPGCGTRRVASHHGGPA